MNELKSISLSKSSVSLSNVHNITNLPTGYSVNFLVLKKDGTCWVPLLPCPFPQFRSVLGILALPLRNAHGERSDSKSFFLQLADSLSEIFCGWRSLGLLDAMTCLVYLPESWGCGFPIGSDIWLAFSVWLSSYYNNIHIYLIFQKHDEILRFRKRPIPFFKGEVLFHWKMSPIYLKFFLNNSETWMNTVLFYVL